MTYDQLRNEIRNYRQYLKDVERLKLEISNIWYELSGVKGVSFDRIPTTPNLKATESRKLELIEKKDELMLEYEHALISVKLIEMKLSKLNEEDKKTCLRIMADGESFESVGQSMGYTKSGMWRRLKRMLEKV